MFFMKWKALAACTLAGLALIAAGCGGGDKAAAGGAKAGGQAARRTPMRKRRLTDFWKLINPRMPK